MVIAQDKYEDNKMHSSIQPEKCWGADMQCYGYYYGNSFMDCIYVVLSSKLLYIASRSSIHIPTAVSTMQGNSQLIGSC